MSTHRAAIEKAVKAGKGRLSEQHLPLVELLRALADQVDASPEPSTRLTASYLSALKDLGRALGAEPKTPSAGGKLAELRRLQRMRGVS
jgi:hypothetical protein